MALPASRSRTVFRACVVNAVREGEALMEQLVAVTRTALTEDESSVRNIQQRNLVSDALRLLRQHEAGLVKAYPMALLETFAEGPSHTKARPAEDTGMDFGELSLMDESEVLAQVELSRAQQIALHATDATLSELNTLVSSAQGLRSVQPERNPFRPENYIRALQQVVGDTGVSADVRQLWMQHMRELLGKQLVTTYQRATKSLREHGIEPVGYAVVGMPGGTGRGSLMGGGYAASQMGYPSAYGGPASDAGMTGGYSTHGGWGAGSSTMGVPLAPDAEEALLTVGILRQMLAGGGDPFSFDGGAGMPMPAGDVPSRPAAAGAAGAPAGYFSADAVAEAMHDMAQLERLVGRLAGGGGNGGPVSDWGGRSAPGGLGAVSAPSSLMGGVASRSAAEVVSRMMGHIAQDARLLPPVQQAVQQLQPAILQLVQRDNRFFSDEQHPARRLLDDLTQRSMAFQAENDTGFSSFMRLLKEAVTHLASAPTVDAAAFDTVLKALHKAWAAQERKLQEYRESEQQALLLSERREMLAKKIAADIRKLPDANKVPADLLAFVTGPWSRVVALAQTQAGDDESVDPGGYLAMVPLLFWCAQPELLRAEPDRLGQAIAGMLGTVREGLQSIDHPEDQTDMVLERLVTLHQTARDYADAVAQAGRAPGETGAESLASELSADVPLEAAQDAPATTEAGAAPAPMVEVGQWIELTTNRRAVRTQLTWCSPHGTLFLFTAADGSTQSMTLRMLAKLAGEGMLKVLPIGSVPDRAPGASSDKAAKTRPGKLTKNR